MNDNPYAAPETLDSVPIENIYAKQARCIAVCFRIAVPLSLVLILVIELTSLRHYIGFDAIPLNPDGIRAITFSLFVLGMHEGCIYISRKVRDAING